MRRVVLYARRVAVSFQCVSFVHILVNNEDTQGAHVSFEGALKVSRQIGFPKRVTADVAHGLDESYLLW